MSETTKITNANDYFNLTEEKFARLKELNEQIKELEKEIYQIGQRLDFSAFSLDEIYIYKGTAYKIGDWNGVSRSDPFPFKKLGKVAASPLGSKERSQSPTIDRSDLSAISLHRTRNAAVRGNGERR